MTAEQATEFGKRLGWVEAARLPREARRALERQTQRESNADIWGAEMLRALRLEHVGLGLGVDVPASLESAALEGYRDGVLAVVESDD